MRLSWGKVLVRFGGCGFYQGLSHKMSAGFYSGCAEGVVDKLGQVRCGGESSLKSSLAVVT